MLLAESSPSRQNQVTLHTVFGILTWYLPLCRELAETILDSGDTLLTILGDILDFSKIDHNSMVLESAPVSSLGSSSSLHPCQGFARLIMLGLISPCYRHFSLIRGSWWVAVSRLCGCELEPEGRAGCDELQVMCFRAKGVSKMGESAGMPERYT